MYLGSIQYFFPWLYIVSVVLESAVHRDKDKKEEYLYLFHIYTFNFFPSASYSVKINLFFYNS